MSCDESNSATDGTRRSFLGAIAGVSLLGNDRFGRLTRRVRVVTARGGPNHEPIETEKVPKRWHRHEKAMRDAVRRVADAVGASETTYRGTTTREVDGFSYSIPVVATPDGDGPTHVAASELGVDVPGRAAHAEVRIEPTDSRPEPLSGSCTATASSTGTYDGGSMMCEGTATSGYRIRRTNQCGSFMVTANHPTDDDIASCPDVEEGSTISYRTNTGRIVDGDDVRDWAVFTPDSLDDDVFSDDINMRYDSDGDGVVDYVTIGGYKTYSGLETAQANGDTVHKAGISTQYTTGVVEGIDDGSWGQKGCVRMGGSGVRVSNPGQDGDSGGPLWFESGGEAQVIGHTVMGDSDHTVSWPAYKIVESGSYTVG